MRVANLFYNYAEFEHGTAYEHRGKLYLFVEALHYDVHRYWLFSEYPGWLDYFKGKIALPTNEQKAVLDRFS